MMKSRFSIALCAAAFFYALPATAQTPATQPETRNPKPETPFLNPSAISTRALPNGVKGIVQANPGADLVSIQIWVKAGSRYENKDNNGVTHLIETLALRGAGSTPDPAATGISSGVQQKTPIVPQKIVEGLGGTLGSLSARDSLFYSATVAAPFLPETLRALSAATLNPDLADAKVEEAKEELLGELAALADPLRQSSDLAYASAFANHPYRRPAQGTAAGIAALTGNKVRLYHKARFAGANISVVISGDVLPETGHKLIAQNFSSAPKAEAEIALAADKPLTGVLRESRRGNLPVSVLTFAFPSPSVRSATDAVAADVLLAHWKEGRDAALGRVLRINAEEESDDGEGDEKEEAAPAPEEENPETAPLALGFEVDYLTQKDGGLFLISVIAPFDRAAATSAILEEITRVQKEGIPEEDESEKAFENDRLSRAKNLLRQQYIQQGETLSGQAGSLGFYDAIDSYQFATSYLERIEKITNEDIKRMASQYFKTDAHVQVTIEGIRPPVQEPEGGTITAKRLWFKEKGKR